MRTGDLPQGEVLDGDGCRALRPSPDGLGAAGGWWFRVLGARCDQDTTAAKGVAACCVEHYGYERRGIDKLGQRCDESQEVCRLIRLDLTTGLAFVYTTCGWTARMMGKAA
jgi:hypothetical protein